MLIKGREFTDTDLRDLKVEIQDYLEDDDDVPQAVPKHEKVNQEKNDHYPKMGDPKYVSFC